MAWSSRKEAWNDYKSCLVVLASYSSTLHGIFTMLYFCRKLLLTFVYVYFYSNCEMASGGDVNIHCWNPSIVYALVT